MAIVTGICLLAIGLALIASGVEEFTRGKVTPPVCSKPYGFLRVIDGGRAGEPKLKGNGRGL